MLSGAVFSLLLSLVLSIPFALGAVAVSSLDVDGSGDALEGTKRVDLEPGKVRRMILRIFGTASAKPHALADTEFGEIEVERQGEVIWSTRIETLRDLKRELMAPNSQLPNSNTGVNYVLALEPNYEGLGLRGPSSAVPGWVIEDGDRAILKFNSSSGGSTGLNADFSSLSFQLFPIYSQSVAEPFRVKWDERIINRSSTGAKTVKAIDEENVAFVMLRDESGSNIIDSFSLVRQLPGGDETLYDEANFDDHRGYVWNVKAEAFDTTSAVDGYPHTGIHVNESSAVTEAFNSGVNMEVDVSGTGDISIIYASVEGVGKGLTEVQQRQRRLSTLG